MRRKVKGRSKLPALFLGAGLLTISVPNQLMAQSQPVSGIAVDASGGVIPGATVTIKDVNKNQVVRTTTTDANGRFQQLDIQPGRYEVTVEHPGFKTADIFFDVDVNRVVSLGNITLPVGEVTQTVSVSEVAPAVDTESSDKAYLVDQHQISQLPMNGRNWVALMSTVPGMTSSTQSDFGTNFNDVSGFHGLGGRGSENNFYLDGSPNVDVGDNQSQYTQPSIDALGEFRVLQSAFNAEYGRSEGVAIAVQTKSGTASFHGDAYEYLRNNYFDAKSTNNTTGTTLRYNQFGGNLGGWLWIPKISTPQNKKIFFFYNREMTRRNYPSGNYTDVPSAQVLGGDFSPFLTSTVNPYDPTGTQLVGQIYKPGTATRDSAGHINGGVPYVGNVVPQNQWNPLSSALLKVYTQAIPGYANMKTGPGVSPGFVRYYWTNPDILRKDQDLARVDYQVNEKFSTFFRWVNDYQKESFAKDIWGGEPFPIQAQQRPKPGSSWSLNFVNTFSPTLAAETILSYNKQSQSLSVTGTNPISLSALGISNFPQLYPATNITDSVPNVSTNAGFGWNLGNPGWHNWGKDFAITENVTKVVGEHTFKFGTYLNQDYKAQTATWPQNPSIDFSSGTSSAFTQDTGNGLANLMLGNYASYSEANAAIYPYFGFREADFYFQDTWKVTRRLTLNYGLRYAWIEPTYTIKRGGTPGGEGTFNLYSVDLSKYNRANAPTIDPSTGNLGGANVFQELTNIGLICDPCSGVHPGFSPSKNFLQPRIGFAYDLFGNGKTALRAGFGMFNERLRQNNFNFGAGSNYPNQFSSTVYYNNVSNPATGTVPAQQAPGMTIFPTNNTMPTIYSWYAGIQHELGSGFTLDLSYSGNHSVHLMDQRALNALPIGTFAPGVVKPGRVETLYPYYGWGNLTAVETDAYSRYNALLVRVSRRFIKGLTGSFNYTFSRAMDVADNDSDYIVNPFNIAQSYAPAGYDQTHVFETNWVYDLPKFTQNRLLGALVNGWELTAILSAHSGMPFSVTSNGDLQGVNLGSQYANLVGDPYAGRNRSQLLNPAAFTRPADGTWGNTTRNQFRLPWIQNLDSSLIRNFNFTENVKVQFRGEVFNVLNHPEIWSGNFGFSADTPGAGLSSKNATFGEVNSWRDPREIQLALRFQF